MKLIKKLPYKTRRPVVYSFDSNWAGREMHTISEFCFIIDNSKSAKMTAVDFNEIKDYEFLAPGERRGMASFDEEAYELLLRYRAPDEFRRILKNNLDFRDAQFINCQNKCLWQMANYKDLTTFVLPQYLKAGRYSYIVEYPENTFYFHNAAMYYRTENIPLKFQLPPPGPGGAGQDAAQPSDSDRPFEK